MGINLDVLVLLIGSGIVCLLAMGATVTAISIVAGWDPTDSGRRQLAKERRLVLVEITTKVVLGFQLMSLVAFVAVIERLHSLFPGAMCAVGTLNAHPLGYPTLLIKVTGFLLCSLWLIFNRATRAAISRGLLRLKYGLLVPVALVLATENVLQFRFLSGLRPDVITSCCSTVFSQSGRGMGAELAALPTRETRIVFFAVLALTLGAGLRLVRRGRSPAVFSLLSLVFGAVGLASVLAWIAPAIYELPTHHCPLCLLAAPHRTVGYLLYASLAVGLLAGCGIGVIRLSRRLDVSGEIRLGEEVKLCAASIAGFSLFSLLGSWSLLEALVRQGGA